MAKDADFAKPSFRPLTVNSLVLNKPSRDSTTIPQKRQVSGDGTFSNMMIYNKVKHKRPSVPPSSLDRSIESKLELKSSLITKISTSKTLKSTQQLSNYKLEDELMALKSKLAFYNDQIQELNSHEQESLTSVDDKYNLNSKQIKLDYDERLISLKESISASIEKVIAESNSQLELKRNKLSNDYDETMKKIQYQKTDLNRSLIKLKEDYHKKKITLFDQMNESINSLKHEMTQLESVIIERQEVFRELLNTSSSDLDETNKELTQELASVKSLFSSQQSEISNLKSGISDAKLRLENMKKSIDNKSLTYENISSSITEINDTLANQEYERRYLHNKLQELKGNIRVFCRIRPVSFASELIDIDYPDNELNDDANQELIISKDSQQSSYSLVNSLNNNNYKFQFDKVFSSSLTNADIFEDLSQLIQSSLDGKNVCIFAYGQTGSGKTWTMSHPDDGMIPLSINKVFDDIETLLSKGWTHSVEGQFIEIYNETLIDLLSLDPHPNKKLEIKHDDANCKTTITNVTKVGITSKKQAKQLLARATRNRSTASTMANERSSRSHSIFVIEIKGENKKTGESCLGVLNLIDLAGSERLSNSQVKGERLKETQAINKSLSSLGDVIFSLRQKQGLPESSNQHIPYRNSKLTYYLKHSLGGDSKTLMFVNISPLSKNLNETINSLRFATKVNNTHITK